MSIKDTNLRAYILHCLEKENNNMTAPRAWETLVRDHRKYHIDTLTIGKPRFFNLYYELKRVQIQLDDKVEVLSGRTYVSSYLVDDKSDIPVYIHTLEPYPSLIADSWTLDKRYYWRGCHRMVMVNTREGYRYVRCEAPPAKDDNEPEYLFARVMPLCITHKQEAEQKAITEQKVRDLKPQPPAVGFFLSKSLVADTWTPMSEGDIEIEGVKG